MTRGRKSCTEAAALQDARGGGGENRRSRPHLHHVGAHPAVEPHPVAGRDHADPGHAAEEAHPNAAPVVAKVTGVDLSAEHGQDEGQDGQQVDLAPGLRGRGERRVKNGPARSRLHSRVTRGGALTCPPPPPPALNTHSVAVKSVEDSGDVAAEDAHGNASVVQRQPAPTRLL